MQACAICGDRRPGLSGSGRQMGPGAAVGTKMACSYINCGRDAPTVHCRRRPYSHHRVANSCSSRPQRTFATNACALAMLDRLWCNTEKGSQRIEPQTKNKITHVTEAIVAWRRQMGRPTCTVVAGSAAGPRASIHAEYKPTAAVPVGGILGSACPGVCLIARLGTTSAQLCMYVYQCSYDV